MIIAIRFIVLGVIVLIGGGIAPTCDAAVREIPLQVNPEVTALDGKDIHSYPAAVDAILRAMVRKYDLPMPAGKLLIYDTRAAFEEGLIEYLKIAPELARDTARIAKSAVGSCNVLVNEPAVAESSWPERIELLAHELTHSVELALANQCGLASQQWLLEGFAEWVAYNITDALGLDELDRVRARLTEKVSVLRRKDALPSLTQLNTFRQWVRARAKYGFDGTYSLAFLVTDYLVERHSLRDVMNYFVRFRRSGDDMENFRLTFGETLQEFANALDLRLKRSLD